MMSDAKNKVFVIGLDGATWDVLTPLMHEGKMPFLRQMSEKAATSNLESTIPPMTGCAWTSFQTGLSPGNHGIFHFVKFDRASKELRFVNSSNLKSKTIWEIASEFDKKVISINVPMTYPPLRVNGIMISGIPIPSQNAGIAYPNGLYEEILDHVKEYKAVVHQHVYFSRGLDYFVDQLIQTIENRKKTALYLLKKYEWDLFMVHFQSVDVLQHALWNIIINSPGTSEREKTVVYSFYQRLDEIIARLFEEIDERTTTVIMSDHGFGGDKKVFYINRWLMNEGLLVPHKRLKAARFPSHVANLLRKVDKRRLRSIFFKTHKRRTFILNEVNKTINWALTSALALTVGPYALLFLNQGAQGQDSEAQLREKIIKKLGKITDPSNGNQIISEVLFKEQIYQGASVGESPDMVCVAKNGYAFDFHLGASKRTLLQNLDPVYQPPGSHRTNGILLLVGNSVSKNSTLISPRIFDIAPTILFTLGVPIPKSMEGRVLTEAFTSEFLKKNKPIIKDMKDDPSKLSDYDFSSEEQMEIQKSLSGLGYF